MRDDLGAPELPGLSGIVNSVGGGPAEGAIALPRVALGSARLRLSHPRLRVSRPVYGHLALATMVLACLALVVCATAGPSVLVPSSSYAFPGWMAGPLGHLLGDLHASSRTLNYGLSGVLVAMSLAYAVALGAVRLLSMRVIVIAIVALHVVLLLTPPLALTDVFNYLGYARLGALHHLNPYTHVIEAERHDPIFGLSTWHHLESPYGPAFTLLSYPLGLLPLPVGYWVLKVATVLAGLGFVGLVWRCARQLGRDPRFAVLFVAANPIYLVYELGGFHNDVFMLVPALAAVSFLLAGRDRMSGAALVLAIAVKFTMALLLPFLLLAARPPCRRGRVLTGMALGAIPLALASYAAFGLALPNAADQTTIVTPFSLPTLAGLVLGFGGASPEFVRMLTIGLVAAVALLIARVARGRAEWLSSAGFATMALLASMAWLMPWYVVWLLPLAALGGNLRLRRVALAITAFLLLTFLPATGVLLGRLHVNPMATPVGRAANAHAQSLEH